MDSNKETTSSDVNVDAPPMRRASRISDISEPPATPNPPANIRETKAWKASQQGFSRMVNNYVELLRTSFQNMNRESQEALIQKLCVIVTLGVSCIGLLLFYGVIPSLARVLVVPVAFCAAYWASNKIVTPVVLARLEGLLNKE